MSAGVKLDARPRLRPSAAQPEFTHRVLEARAELIYVVRCHLTQLHMPAAQPAPSHPQVRVLEARAERAQRRLVKAGAPAPSPSAR